MNKTKFIEQLRATAAELHPLTQSTSHGAKTWDGSKYVQYFGETKIPNPYALSWQTMLGTIADLLEAQESPLCQKQVSYLEHILFGGMGSLNDLSFEPKSNGDLAIAVNEQLDKQRRALYASFKED